MKPRTTGTLISLLFLGALLAFALWIHQGRTLLAFYGVILAVIVLGWALRWAFRRGSIR